jgi:DNA-binding NtrC family response regulator
MRDEGPIQLLIVDGQQSIRRLCMTIARNAGLSCMQAATGSEALELLEKYAPELMLTDQALSDMSGLELLEEAKRRNPLIEVALMSAIEPAESAIEVLRLGAYDLIGKPFRVERLKLMLVQMAEKARLMRENELLRGRLQNRVVWTPCTNLEELEKTTMQRVLVQVHGDKEKARQMLGISRATLYRKIKRYSLHSRPARESEESRKGRGSDEPVIVLSQS